MNYIPRSQQGAVLIVALVMLLVITLLAVSSTRESALETRMTANFVSQQKQLNYADAALREGEEQMVFASKVARDVNGDDDYVCADTDRYCFLNKNAEYGHLFGSCDAAIDEGIGATLLSGDAYDDDALDPPTMRWYALEAPTSKGQGAAKNPEYGTFAKDAPIERYYEVTAVAQDQNGNSCTILRSAAWKQF